MLLPFKLGLGGPLGTGHQFWNWIELADAVATIRHVLRSDQINGAVNVVAPQSVTNAEFTRTLARCLGRPAVLKAPAFALRLVLGEMADAALLASTRAVPQRLLATGFSFGYPELGSALEGTLERGGRR